MDFLFSFPLLSPIFQHFLLVPVRMVLLSRLFLTSQSFPFHPFHVMFFFPFFLQYLPSPSFFLPFRFSFPSLLLPIPSLLFSLHTWPQMFLIYHPLFLLRLWLLSGCKKKRLRLILLVRPRQKWMKYYQDQQ